MGFKINKSAVCLAGLIISSTMLAMNKSPDDHLFEKIENLVNMHADFHIGVEIYSLKNNKILYAKNERQRFTPASNTKIATSLSALEFLGENYKFQTRLLTDGTPEKDTLNGNLCLQGSGDPSLTSENVEKLIKSLHETGVRTVNGNFYIDREEFDHECFAAGTTIDDLGESWYNPVEALIIDHTAVEIDPLNIVAFTNSEKLQKIFFDGSQLLSDLLKKYAITLTGKFLFKQADNACDIIAEHKSEPLSTLVKHLMKESDNLYADCLFKKLGATHEHSAGSWQNGGNALKHFFQSKLELNPDNIKIADGSGLSRYNLLSAHQIVMLLCWASEQPYFPAFLESLPIAGVDGTLKNRMREISHKVKAKTGTMGGVSALSGYIETDEDTLIFAFLINGFIASSTCLSCKTEIEDVLCKILVDTLG